MFDLFEDFATERRPATGQATGPNIPEPMDCMRCGVCLNQCPTYVLTRDDQQSPRQRIRSLSRLLLEQQPLAPEAIGHLQSCVQCRACETVCPSRMDWSALYDQAHPRLAKREQGLYARLGLALIANKSRLNALLPLLKLYQVSGLRRLARMSGLLGRLRLQTADDLARAPTLTALAPSYPAVGKRLGSVALFTGCITDRFDRQTLDAAIKVLTRLGYQVVIPHQQVCCGALHYHNGERQTAATLMRRNLDCFNRLEVQAVVYCATGCGAQLQDYARMLELEGTAFKPALYEICAFIDDHWNDDLNPRPLEKNVAVHEACSQRNALKNTRSMHQILARIPGLTTHSPPDNHVCCGAGGSYLLTHPNNANALREMKWRQVDHRRTDYLVTANIGCALHLQAGRPESSSIEIRHPVCLIAEVI